MLMDRAAAWASQTQSYQVYRYWDSDEYFLMAQQFAAGEPVTAVTPSAFRSEAEPSFPIANPEMLPVPAFVT